MDASHRAKITQRIAVALDTSDREQFGEWASWFGSRVGVLKVGLEAFVRWGPAAVEEAAADGRAVFLDLKFHDIPNTVRGAVRSARDLGVRYLTVHASGGRAMLEAAVEAARGEVAILAVTLLTHLDEAQLRGLDLAGSAPRRVHKWARLARQAGCAGVVCSPLEAAALRRANPSPFLLVTPGIRPASASPGDQRRTATPREALSAGADLLVIGRPLTQAPDRRAALHEIAAELSGSSG